MRAGIKQSCLAGARHLASAVGAAALWTAWLLLLLLLMFQGYIAAVKQLEVPRFLLHAIESHLAESGVSVAFGRAIFDPSGRVLLERARFKLASFNEPVVTARAIYMRLDPLALLEGRFEASEIRATGADLFIPAMLSRSGSAEKVVEDLDAGFSITSTGGGEFSVDYLNCFLGGVSVSAHGAINAGTPGRPGATPSALPLAEFVAHNYVALSREFSRAEEQMAALDHAALTAVLTPSTTRGALIDAHLRAPGLKMTAPFALEARDLVVSARLPLLGSEPLMASATASAESLQLGKTAAAGVRARIRGILRVDTLSFDPKQLELTAASVSGQGATALAPVARLTPGDGRRFTAEVSAWLFGSPVWARADVDPATSSADVNFDASVSPGVLDLLSARTKVSIRRFVDFSAPVAATGRVRFAPGWKFADGKARVDGRDLVAYGVKIDEARGLVTYDGTHFAAREAVVLSGDNLARGSYEQNFTTLDFRYLLQGRLRPLDISPWFGGGGWWQNLFKDFGFPASPPDATVDVQGRYRHGRFFSVFGYGEAKDPVLAGIALDGVSTRLYIDQSVCEGFEVAAAKGSGRAQGAFRLATEPAHGTWSGLDIDLSSTLDPTAVGELLAPAAAEALATFSFDRAPSISARGHFDGPASGGERHKSLHVEVHSDSGLRAHGVAFGKASFKFDLRDDDVDVSEIEAAFAGGTVTGTAAFTGAGADRRLRLKASLTGASLGQAAAAAEGYVSRSAERSPALDTFAREKSDVLLDLNAAAEGRPGDLDSFVGDGSVQIQGGELGELSLLGGLSRLLKVTELRFTQVRAQYKIEHSALVFSELSVTGANSAIEAKGTYSIDKRQLDFSGRIYPFQESRSILQVFNALSAPLSAAFRVKLSGSIDKPTWNFAYSPLTLLRAGEVRADSADRPVPPFPLVTP